MMIASSQYSHASERPFFHHGLGNGDCFCSGALPRRPLPVLPLRVPLRQVRLRPQVLPPAPAPVRCRRRGPSYRRRRLGKQRFHLLIGQHHGRARVTILAVNLSPRFQVFARAMALPLTVMLTFIAVQLILRELLDAVGAFAR